MNRDNVVKVILVVLGKKDEKDDCGMTGGGKSASWWTI